MPIDTDIVKSAFDSFEKEDFVDAKEKLTGQIKIAKNDFLKNKLGLENDVIPVEDPETNNNNDLEDEDNYDSLEDEDEPIPNSKKRLKSIIKR